MSNIISSDLYRVRRGAALRNTFICLMGIVLLVMTLMLVSQSEAGREAMLSPPGNMTAADQAELAQDMAEVQQVTQHITGGAAFGLDMLAQFFAPFFFLPITIAVFCADFSAGTYRNTLSYESNRTRVYLAKLALSIVLCLAMVVAMVVLSWLAGSIAFGFTGFSAAYFGQLLTTLLLQLPLYVGFVAVCHCIIAITKKSSTTIAVFLVGCIGLMLALQLLASSIPGLEWLALLDPQTGGKMMAAYATTPLNNILFVAGYHTGIAAAATLLGIGWYRKTDMP